MTLASMAALLKVLPLLWLITIALIVMAPVLACWLMMADRLAHKTVLVAPFLSPHLPLVMRPPIVMRMTLSH